MAMIDWDGGLAPEHLAALQKAAAYRSMVATEGYKRLLDFLESWSDQALQAMREARLGDDRVRLNLQLVWSERENTLAEIQREVQRGIAQGKALAAELDADELVSAGMPMEFSENQ